MTGAPSGDEIRARIAEVRRRLRPHVQAQRDAQLRAGRAKPRTAREWEIFAANLPTRTDTPEGPA